MTLRCAIIDDEPLAAELLAGYAERTPGLRITGVYGSAVAAMKDLRQSPVDLLFLDIQMPELSGLEFARLLPTETRVVFTTAFDRYAVDGYKVNAAGYLLKPVSYEQFAATVATVAESVAAGRRRSAAARDGFVYVKSEYKLVRVDLADISHIEGVKDYVKIYLGGRRRALMSLMSMKTLEDSLPRGQFIRVHRSFIVNMAKVTMIDRGRIVVGEDYIPVSESYKDRVQEYIDDHCLQ